MKSPSDEIPLHLRALIQADAKDALTLYSALTIGPPCDDVAAFCHVIAHAGTTVFGAFKSGNLASMVTLHILPNVTWGGRPYGLIENVITRPDHRRTGLGRAALEHALARAWEADAYKVMLLTGQKRGALGFYTAVGFSSEDKHGLVIRSP
jgi:GNAT superfamily N-acetyltransferase